MKNSYRIVLMGVSGAVVSGSVIVANAEKLSATKQYQQNVKVTQKYYMNYGFEEVLLSYQNLVESDTATGDEFLQAAEELFDAGESDKAIEVLRKAVQVHPDQSELYVKMMDIYKQNGNLEKAEEIREQGLERTGDSKLKKEETAATEESASKTPEKKPQALIPQMLEDVMPEEDWAAASQDSVEAANLGNQMNADQSQTASVAQETPAEELQKQLPAQTTEPA